MSQPPADLGRSGRPGPMQLLMPVLGSCGGMAMMLTRPNRLVMIAAGVIALVSVLGGVGMALQTRTASRRTAAETRRRYLAHLADVRQQLARAADAQAADARWRHPPPSTLWPLIVDRSRLWERRAGDPDHLVVRVGTGRVPLACQPAVDLGRDPMRVDDPVCAEAARRLRDRWSTLDAQPLTIDLAGTTVAVVRGPRSRSVALARALVAQACALHAPDDLQVAVAVGPDRLGDWSWCKWLPHAQDAELADGAGPGRLLATSYEQFEAVAHQEVTGRQGSRAGLAGRLLVVVDGLADDRLAQFLAASPSAGITVLHVLDRTAAEPDGVDAEALVDEHGELSLRVGGERFAGVADELPLDDADVLARALAPLRLSAGTSGGGRAGGSVGAAVLLGVDDVAEVDPALGWQPRRPADFLNVPIGTGPDGAVVRLDLKESALGGHGPHGLLIGATGSGKSELLRALLVALVATHPPESLSMVLVDFKGGAAFAGLADLPHVAGTITNLADDLGMVDRMREALIGEQRRRQELLASAGKLANIREYQTLRARERPDLPPLPNLLVVIDEFSELLSERPEMIDVFVGIGRLGRSLGIHLLFSSQRLEEGKLRGLDSHLSYRLGLRTFSAAESRTVLGVPDAYELPPIPGAGYLKVDTTVFQRLQSGYVSGPYRPRTAAAEEARPRPVPFTPTTVLDGDPDDAADAAEVTGPSELDVVVDRLRGAAPRCHQVWVAPLPPAVTLDTLVGPVDEVEGRGLVATRWPALGALKVPLGLADRPLEQRTDVLVQDLSGAAGHLAVVGAPQTGKSMVLRSLVGALALTHSPREVQVHAVDLGGGGLANLAELPHVGTVGGRTDPPLVRRIVAEVHAQLARREALFAAESIDSVAEYRRRRAAGDLADEPYGDLFLLVDGWTAFKQGFEDLEAQVVDVAARGLGYGLHVAITAGRWMDIRPQLKDAIGARFELRLNDPLDSEIDRKVAKLLAGAPPGRGLARDKSICHFPLPRIDGQADPATTGTGMASLVHASRAAWPHDGARQVRTLPDVVKAGDLGSLGEDGARGVVIGLGEADLLPLRLDLVGNEPNLVVLGDSESGKTAFLRAFAHQLVASASPDAAQVLVVDYRRSLLDVVPAPYLWGYAGSAPAVTTAVGRLREELMERLPGADLTSAELRARSWWSGPEVYVLVDDYDLVVSPTGNPLGPLAELLPQARDIGLHLVIARRSAGVSRALFEPVLQRVRELGAQHLLLSGDPAEGAVAGPHRMVPRIPGRGLLVRRAGATLVQAVWVPEPDAF